MFSNVIIGTAIILFRRDCIILSKSEVFGAKDFPRDAKRRPSSSPSPPTTEPRQPAALDENQEQGIRSLWGQCYDLRKKCKIIVT
jgi:hypothetical protein